MDSQFSTIEANEGYPAINHEEYLNEGNYSHVPHSVHHLADHLESGGEKIEDVLTRFDSHYQSLFFLASWAILLIACFTFPVSLFRLEISILIDCLLLLVGGFVIMVLNIPGTPRWAGRYRRLIQKQSRFLTRLTGKALTLIYLGTLVKDCLWPSRSKRSVFLILLTILLTFFIYFVGTLGLWVAIRKSLRLERLRRSLQCVGWPDMYRKYAITDPAHGMQFQEFNCMASDYSGGELLFNQDDLKLIFSALDEHQKNAINEVEFQQWVSSGYSEDIEGGYNRSVWFTMTYL